MGAADLPMAAVAVGSVAPVGVADLALAEQAAHCGRMLEQAMKAGDRDLALVWQAAMYSIVGLRRSRRFGMDTQACEGGVHGG